MYKIIIITEHKQTKKKIVLWWVVYLYILYIFYGALSAVVDGCKESACEVNNED